MTSVNVPFVVIAKEMQRGGPAVLPRPVHAVGEKQILPAVAVVVDECDARTQRFRQILLSERAGVVGEGQSRGFRDIRELNRRGGGWLK